MNKQSEKKDKQKQYTIDKDKVYNKILLELQQAKGIRKIHRLSEELLKTVGNTESDSIAFSTKGFYVPLGEIPEDRTAEVIEDRIKKIAEEV